MTEDRPRALVVGGGLLGGAVLGRLGVDGRRASGIAWADPPRARRQLYEMAAAHAAAPGWRAAWCAGVSVVGATDDAMREEHDHLRAFVEGLGRGSGDGRLFVASSAGGVHGRGSHGVVTEADQPSPRSAYGHGKVALEAAIEDWAHETGASVLVGRISNLYGPAQAGKGTGFLSQACLRALVHQPVTLRVPLETMRDFVHADDVAARVTAWLGDERAGRDGSGHLVKLLVSGSAVTLGRAVAVVRAVSRRRTLMVHVADPSMSEQPRYLRFRSTVLPDLDHRHPARPLEIGVHEVFESVRSAHLRGGR